jgi:hypothetical protein
MGRCEGLAELAVLAARRRPKCLLVGYYRNAADTHVSFAERSSERWPMAQRHDSGVGTPRRPQTAGAGAPTSAYASASSLTPVSICSGVTPE